MRAREVNHRVISLLLAIDDLAQLLVHGSNGSRSLRPGRWELVQLVVDHNPDLALLGTRGVDGRPQLLDRHVWAHHLGDVEAAPDARRGRLGAEVGREALSRVGVSQVRGVQVWLSDEDVAGCWALCEEGLGRLEDLQGGAELRVRFG